MGITPLRFALALVPLAGFAFHSSTEAQESMKSVPGFDPGRAILNDTWGFDPFRVTSWESLADALEAGRVADDTPLLVLSGWRAGALPVERTVRRPLPVQ